ncbi:MAG TPA: LysR family transcriptional regulator [Actinocrinis sp.]|nr:LysR family transcriptional regulator [Actinocrinis sp.]
MRHLRTVLAVAEAGSISRAASALKIAQPGLTAQLRRIEAGFGGPLFERRPGGVAPTELGAHVILRARQLISEFEELVVTTKMLAHEIEPAAELKLGGADSPWMPVVAAALRRLLPDREQITYVEERTDAVLEMARTGKVDIAVFDEFPEVPTPTTEGLVIRDLGVEPMRIGLAADHPSAGWDSVDLAALAYESWIAPPESACGLRLSLRLACERAGFTPRFRHFGANRPTVETIVASGHAVGVFHHSTRRMPGIRLVRLVGEPLWCRTKIAWPTESLIAQVAEAFDFRRLTVPALTG